MGSKKRSTTAPKATRRTTANSESGGSGARKPPAYLGSYLGGGDDLDASLQVEARRRYLNYAMSVITSRALPDVRDGLKPVQRRILYAMSHDEHLHPNAKYRKSAKVVGSVIGRYHPHGDTAVYDAMVRMAQDFSMRVPLVDGEGNFGSLDGDAAAAYRYTECRLAPPAQELLQELGEDTVEFRGNYDGTTTEPIVLPARFPNLLVNGCTGIAVGMATNIPPHNLREVTKALIALADNPDLQTLNLLKYIKGPDFPTGGQMLNSKVELREIYERGRGAIRVRGQYKLEPQRRGPAHIVITSIPFALNRATLVEKIADVIINRKLPQLIDVRDESTDKTRIVMETKKGANPELIMAYLYKHTPLQLNFNMNMTALVPTSLGSGVSQPAKLSIKEVLQHFLDFRYQVTKRRYEYQLAAVRKRIHLLEGFVVIFDALDEAIAIIRNCEGKKDAANKLMARFGLDDLQVDAILELKLYKLAKLEINVIRKELREKRSLERKLLAVLKSDTKLWGVVKQELQSVADELGGPRRTKTGGEELEFDADAYILDEDAHVVLTKDGWIKRLRELKDPKSTRLREGDHVTAVLPGSTKETVVFFTNYGAAYTIKINDVPASTGYGQPIQKLFKFKDGERIISSFTLDGRAMPPAELLVITGTGLGQRLAIAAFKQPSTKAGRRYVKLEKGDEVAAVVATSESETLVVATRKSYIFSCKASEVNKREKPSKGVIVVKVGDKDQVIACISGKGRSDVMHLESVKGGRSFNISVDARRVKGRGGKGQQLLKTRNVKVVPPEVVIPVLANTAGPSQVH